MPSAACGSSSSSTGAAPAPTTTSGPAERDRWLVHMRAAIAASEPPLDVAAELERYFTMAAEAMRNRE
jgi:truncated hemoglobin YjbI